jgi:2-polyprenyl-3-methyl-5-hydroxy-6-metoxy-1,4-benzoquinol methylase
VTADVMEARVTRLPDTFEFGRNWQRYIDRYLDPERLQIAAESLHDLVGDLAGKTFLDIGAGSGLFSLCAFKAGAARVVSIDVDPNSIAATSALRQKAGAPDNWIAREGSILDPKLVAETEEADVVYSWGVLHHTGDMWTAIRLAAQLVAPNGLFCIAIYNHVTGRLLDSDRWWKIKRAYNHAPQPVQRLMEGAYFCYWLAHQLRARRNPLRAALEYKRSRGMALTTDLVDWLGGYPYEYASLDDVLNFCRDECAMDPLRVIPVPATGTGNNQFVFRRRRDA